MSSRFLHFAGCLLAAVCFAPSAAKAETVFSYVKESGSENEASQSGVFTPKNATFYFSGSKESVNISILGKDGQSWSLELAAPRGTTMAPGRFRDAERASFRSGRSAGVDVSGNGAGCNEVWGDLDIRQVAYDSNGNISALEARFVQHCERENAPPLIGVIRYNMPQRSLRLDSDAGDYVGGGIHKTYYNDSSVFSFSGNTSYLQYSASGLRDDWLALISAPAGRRLRTGTYNTQRFNDATHAGFDFFGNGRGCNQTSGVLRVYVVRTDTGGAITQFYADFEQRCDSSTGSLTGTIRYGF